MRSLFSTNKIPNEWLRIQSPEDLSAIAQSNDKVHVVFKHSTSCSRSHAALSRLQKLSEDDFSKFSFHYLDLLKYRSLSNAIAEQFGVRHESPQMLIIRDGKAKAHTSHEGVSPEFLRKNI